MNRWGPGFPKHAAMVLCGALPLGAAVFSGLVAGAGKE